MALKGYFMPWENLGNVNLWDALFHQTPAPIRWAFGVLTLGVSVLAGSAVRAYNRRLDRIEQEIERANEDRKEQTAELHRRIDRSDLEVTRRLDEVNAHLIEIATNTARGQNNGS